MRQLTTAQKVALAVSMPVTALLLYFLLKKSEDEEEEESGHRRVVTSRQTVIDVRVPRDAVGAVIGHQGAMIKEIRETTGARLDFKDEGGKEGHRVLVIRGSQQGAQQAEMMVRKVIADQPPLVSETVLVPQKALGRIIGRAGETIRHLQRASKCRIMIDRSEDTGPNDTKEIVLRGTPEAIENAKGMLEEKVRDEEAHQAKMEVLAANRQQRGRRKKDDDSSEPTPPDQSQDTALEAPNDIEEKIVESASLVGAPSEAGDVRVQETSWPNRKDYLEVWVSAVEHPGHFWVQVLSARSAQLDELVDQMTKYYLGEEMQQASQVENPKVGDIIAAPFEHDTSWYRARVCEVLDDQLDLYYVDYGDSGFITKDKTRQLRSDFFSLPFQALRCSLANVKPVGEEWRDEDIDVFEDLTYCAKWKSLMAKIITYKDTPNGTLPCIELIDTNQEEDKNVAEELVSQGGAVLDKEDTSFNLDDQPFKSQCQTYLGSGNTSALARWDADDELDNTPWHGRSPFTPSKRKSPCKSSEVEEVKISPDWTTAFSLGNDLSMDKHHKPDEGTENCLGSFDAEGPVFDGFLDSDNDTSPIQSCHQSPPRELPLHDDIPLSAVLEEHPAVNKQSAEVPVTADDVKTPDSLDIGYCSAEEQSRHLEAIQNVSVPSKVPEAEELEEFFCNDIVDADDLIAEDKLRIENEKKQMEMEEEMVDMACISLLAPIAALAMETVTAMDKDRNTEEEQLAQEDKNLTIDREIENPTHVLSEEAVPISKEDSAEDSPKSSECLPADDDENINDTQTELSFGEPNPDQVKQFGVEPTQCNTEVEILSPKVAADLKPVNEKEVEEDISWECEVVDALSPGLGQQLPSEPAEMDDTLTDAKTDIFPEPTSEMETTSVEHQLEVFQDTSCHDIFPVETEENVPEVITQYDNETPQDAMKEESSQFPSSPMPEILANPACTNELGLSGKENQETQTCYHMLQDIPQSVSHAPALLIMANTPVTFSTSQIDEHLKTDITRSEPMAEEADDATVMSPCIRDSSVAVVELDTPNIQIVDEPSYKLDIPPSVIHSTGMLVLEDVPVGMNGFYDQSEANAKGACGELTPVMKVKDKDQYQLSDTQETCLEKGNLKSDIIQERGPVDHREPHRSDENPSSQICVSNQEDLVAAEIPETCSEESAQETTEKYLMEDVPKAVQHAPGVFALSTIPVTINGQHTCITEKTDISQEASTSFELKKKCLSEESVPIEVTELSHTSHTSDHDVIESEPLLSTLEAAMMEGVPSCVTYAVGLHLLYGGALSEIGKKADESINPVTDRTNAILHSNAYQSNNDLEANFQMQKETSQPFDTPVENNHPEGVVTEKNELISASVSKQTQSALLVACINEEDNATAQNIETCQNDSQALNNVSESEMLQQCFNELPPEDKCPATTETLVDTRNEPSCERIQEELICPVTPTLIIHNFPAWLASCPIPTLPSEQKIEATEDEMQEEPLIQSQNESKPSVKTDGVLVTPEIFEQQPVLDKMEVSEETETNLGQLTQEIDLSRNESAANEIVVDDDDDINFMTDNGQENEATIEESAKNTFATKIAKGVAPAVQEEVECAVPNTTCKPTSSHQSYDDEPSVKKEPGLQEPLNQELLPAEDVQGDAHDSIAHEESGQNASATQASLSAIGMEDGNDDNLTSKQKRRRNKKARRKAKDLSKLDTKNEDLTELCPEVQKYLNVEVKSAPINDNASPVNTSAVSTSPLSVDNDVALIKKYDQNQDVLTNVPTDKLNKCDIPDISEDIVPEVQMKSAVQETGNEILYQDPGKVITVDVKSDSEEVTSKSEELDAEQRYVPDNIVPQESSPEAVALQTSTTISGDDQQDLSTDEFAKCDLEEDHSKEIGPEVQYPTETAVQQTILDVDDGIIPFMTDDNLQSTLSTDAVAKCDMLAETGNEIVDQANDQTEIPQPKTDYDTSSQEPDEVSTVAHQSSLEEISSNKEEVCVPELQNIPDVNIEKETSQENTVVESITTTPSVLPEVDDGIPFMTDDDIEEPTPEDSTHVENEVSETEKVTTVSKTIGNVAIEPEDVPEEKTIFDNVEAVQEERSEVLAEKEPVQEKSVSGNICVHPEINFDVDDGIPFMTDEDIDEPTTVDSENVEDTIEIKENIVPLVQGQSESSPISIEETLTSLFKETEDEKIELEVIQDEKPALENIEVVEKGRTEVTDELNQKESEQDVPLPECVSDAHEVLLDVDDGIPFMTDEDLQDTLSSDESVKCEMHAENNEVDFQVQDHTESVDTKTDCDTPNQDTNKVTSVADQSAPEEIPSKQEIDITELQNIPDFSIENETRTQDTVVVSVTTTPSVLPEVNDGIPFMTDDDVEEPTLEESTHVENEESETEKVTTVPKTIRNEAVEPEDSLEEKTIFDNLEAVQEERSDVLAEKEPEQEKSVSGNVCVHPELHFDVDDGIPFMTDDDIDEPSTMDSEDVKNTIEIKENIVPVIQGQSESSPISIKETLTSLSKEMEGEKIELEVIQDEKPALENIEVLEEERTEVTDELNQKESEQDVPLPECVSDAYEVLLDVDDGIPFMTDDDIDEPTTMDSENVKNAIEIKESIVPVIQGQSESLSISTNEILTSLSKETEDEKIELEIIQDEKPALENIEVVEEERTEVTDELNQKESEQDVPLPECVSDAHEVLLDVDDGIPFMTDEDLQDTLSSDESEKCEMHAENIEVNFQVQDHTESVDPKTDYDTSNQDTDKVSSVTDQSAPGEIHSKQGIGITELQNVPDFIENETSTQDRVVESITTTPSVLPEVNDGIPFMTDDDVEEPKLEDSTHVGNEESETEKVTIVPKTIGNEAIESEDLQEAKTIFDNVEAVQEEISDVLAEKEPELEKSVSGNVLVHPELHFDVDDGIPFMTDDDIDEPTTMDSEDVKNTIEIKESIVPVIQGPSESSPNSTEEILTSLSKETEDKKIELEVFQDEKPAIENIEVVEEEKTEVTDELSQKELEHDMPLHECVSDVHEVLLDVDDGIPFMTDDDIDEPTNMDSEDVKNTIEIKESIVPVIQGPSESSPNSTEEILTSLSKETEDKKIELEVFQDEKPALENIEVVEEEKTEVTDELSQKELEHDMPLHECVSDAHEILLDVDDGIPFMTDDDIEEPTTMDSENVEDTIEIKENIVPLIQGQSEFSPLSTEETLTSLSINTEDEKVELEVIQDEKPALENIEVVEEERAELTDELNQKESEQDVPLPECVSDAHEAFLDVDDGIPFMTDEDLQETLSNDESVKCGMQAESNEVDFQVQDHTESVDPKTDYDTSNQDTDKVSSITDQSAPGEIHSKQGIGITELQNIPDFSIENKTSQQDTVVESITTTPSVLPEVDDGIPYMTDDDVEQPTLVDSTHLENEGSETKKVTTLPKSIGNEAIESEDSPEEKTIFDNVEAVQEERSEVLAEKEPEKEKSVSGNVCVHPELNLDVEDGIPFMTDDDKDEPTTMDSENVEDTIEIKENIVPLMQCQSESSPISIEETLTSLSKETEDEKIELEVIQDEKPALENIEIEEEEKTEVTDELNQKESEQDVPLPECVSDAHEVLLDVDDGIPFMTDEDLQDTLSSDESVKCKAENNEVDFQVQDHTESVDPKTYCDTSNQDTNKITSAADQSAPEETHSKQEIGITELQNIPDFIIENETSTLNTVIESTTNNPIVLPEVDDGIPFMTDDDIEEPTLEDSTHLENEGRETEPPNTSGNVAIKSEDMHEEKAVFDNVETVKKERSEDSGKKEPDQDTPSSGSVSAPLDLHFEIDDGIPFMTDDDIDEPTTMDSEHVESASGINAIVVPVIHSQSEPSAISIEETSTSIPKIAEDTPLEAEIIHDEKPAYDNIEVVEEERIEVPQEIKQKESEQDMPLSESVSAAPEVLLDVDGIPVMTDEDLQDTLSNSEFVKCDMQVESSEEIVSEVPPQTESAVHCTDYKTSCQDPDKVNTFADESSQEEMCSQQKEIVQLPENVEDESEINENIIPEIHSQIESSPISMEGTPTTPNETIKDVEIVTDDLPNEKPQFDQVVTVDEEKTEIPGEIKMEKPDQDKIVSGNVSAVPELLHDGDSGKPYMTWEDNLPTDDPVYDIEAENIKHIMPNVQGKYVSAIEEADNQTSYQPKLEEMPAKSEGLVPDENKDLPEVFQEDDLTLVDVGDGKPLVTDTVLKENISSDEPVQVDIKALAIEDIVTTLQDNSELAVPDSTDCPHPVLATERDSSINEFDIEKLEEQEDPRPKTSAVQAQSPITDTQDANDSSLTSKQKRRRNKKARKKEMERSHPHNNSESGTEMSFEIQAEDSQGTPFVPKEDQIISQEEEQDNIEIEVETPLVCKEAVNTVPDANDQKPSDTCDLLVTREDGDTETELSSKQKRRRNKKSRKRGKDGELTESDTVEDKDIDDSGRKKTKLVDGDTALDENNKTDILPEQENTSSEIRNESSPGIILPSECLHESLPGKTSHIATLQKKTDEEEEAPVGYEKDVMEPTEQVPYGNGETGDSDFVTQTYSQELTASQSVAADPVIHACIDFRQDGTPEPHEHVPATSKEELDVVESVTLKESAIDDGRMGLELEIEVPNENNINEEFTLHPTPDIPSVIPKEEVDIALLTEHDLNGKDQNGQDTFKEVICQSEQMSQEKQQFSPSMATYAEIVAKDQSKEEVEVSEMCYEEMQDNKNIELLPTQQKVQLPVMLEVNDLKGVCPIPEVAKPQEEGRVESELQEKSKISTLPEPENTTPSENKIEEEVMQPMSGILLTDVLPATGEDTLPLLEKKVELVEQSQPQQTTVDGNLDNKMVDSCDEDEEMDDYPHRDDSSECRSSVERGTQTPGDGLGKLRRRRRKRLRKRAAILALKAAAREKGEKPNLLIHGSQRKKQKPKEHRLSSGTEKAKQLPVKLAQSTPEKELKESHLTSKDIANKDREEIRSNGEKKRVDKATCTPDRELFDRRNTAADSKKNKVILPTESKSVHPTTVLNNEQDKPDSIVVHQKPSVTKANKVAVPTEKQSSIKDLAPKVTYTKAEEEVSGCDKDQESASMSSSITSTTDTTSDSPITRKESETDGHITSKQKRRRNKKARKREKEGDQSESDFSKPEQKTKTTHDTITISDYHSASDTSMKDTDSAFDPELKETFHIIHEESHPVCDSGSNDAKNNQDNQVVRDASQCTEMPKVLESDGIKGQMGATNVIITEENKQNSQAEAAPTTEVHKKKKKHTRKKKAPNIASNEASTTEATQHFLELGNEPQQENISNVKDLTEGEPNMLESYSDPSTSPKTHPSGDVCIAMPVCNMPENKAENLSAEETSEGKLRRRRNRRMRKRALGKESSDGKSKPTDSIPVSGAEQPSEGRQDNDLQAEMCHEPCKSDELTADPKLKNDQQYFLGLGHEPKPPDKSKGEAASDSDQEEKHALKEQQVDPDSEMISYQAVVKSAPDILEVPGLQEESSEAYKPDSQNEESADGKLKMAPTPREDETCTKGQIENGVNSEGITEEDGVLEEEILTRERADHERIEDISDDMMHHDLKEQGISGHAIGTSNNSEKLEDTDFSCPVANVENDSKTEVPNYPVIVTPDTQTFPELIDKEARVVEDRQLIPTAPEDECHLDTPEENKDLDSTSQNAELQATKLDNVNAEISTGTIFPVRRSPSVDWTEVNRHYIGDLPSVLYHLTGLRILTSLETGTILHLPIIAEEPEVDNEKKLVELKSIDNQIDQVCSYPDVQIETDKAAIIHASQDHLPPQPIAIAVAESVLDDFEDSESDNINSGLHTSESLVTSVDSSDLEALATYSAVTLLSPLKKNAAALSPGLESEQTWPEEFIHQSIKEDEVLSPKSRSSLEEDVLAWALSRPSSGEKPIPTIAVTPSGSLEANSFDQCPDSQFICEKRIIDIEYLIETENVEIVECFKDNVEQPGTLGEPENHERNAGLSDKVEVKQSLAKAEETEKPEKPIEESQPVLSKSAKEVIAEELLGCEHSQNIPDQRLCPSIGISNIPNTNTESDIEVLSEADSLENLPLDSSDCIGDTQAVPSGDQTLFCLTSDSSDPIFALSTNVTACSTHEITQSLTESEPNEILMSTDSLTAEADLMLQSGHSDFETIEMSDVELAGATEGGCPVSSDEADTGSLAIIPSIVTTFTDLEPPKLQGNNGNPASGDHNHPTHRNTESPSNASGDKPPKDPEDITHSDTNQHGQIALDIPEIDHLASDSFDSTDQEVLGLFQDGQKPESDVGWTPSEELTEDVEGVATREKRSMSADSLGEEYLEGSLDVQTSQTTSQPFVIGRKRKGSETFVSDDSLEEAKGGILAKEDTPVEKVSRPIAMSRRRRKLNESSFSEDSLDDGSKEVETIFRRIDSFDHAQEVEGSVEMQDQQKLVETMELVEPTSTSHFQQSGIEFLLASYKPTNTDEIEYEQMPITERPAVGAVEEDQPPISVARNICSADSEDASIPMVVITTDKSPLPPEVVEMVISGARPPKDIIEPYLKRFEQEEQRKQQKMFEKHFTQQQHVEKESAFSVVTPGSAKKLHGKTSVVGSCPDPVFDINKTEDQVVPGRMSSAEDLNNSENEFPDPVEYADCNKQIFTETKYDLGLTSCAFQQIQTEEVLAVHKVHQPDEDNEEVGLQSEDSNDSAEICPFTADKVMNDYSDPNHPEESQCVKDETEWFEEFRETKVECKQKGIYMAPKQSVTPVFDPTVCNAWAFPKENKATADWPCNFPDITVDMEENLNAEVASDRPDDSYARVVSPELHCVKNENLTEIYYGREEKDSQIGNITEESETRVIQYEEPGQLQKAEIFDQTNLLSSDSSTMDGKSQRKRDLLEYSSEDDMDITLARDQIFQMATGVSPLCNKKYAKEKEEHFLSDDNLGPEMTNKESDKIKVAGSKRKIVGRAAEKKMMEEEKNKLPAEGNTLVSGDDRNPSSRQANASASNDKDNPPLPPKPKSKGRAKKGLLKKPGSKQSEKSVTFEDGDSATSSDASDIYYVDKVDDNDTDTDDDGEYKIKPQFAEKATKL